MTSIFRLTLTSTLISALFFGLIPVASAHQDVTTFLPASFSSWSTYGSPSVSSERVVIEGSQREWVYIDLKADEINEAYLAIASYVEKSDSRTSYSTVERKHSGNPYIYAYEIDANGKIIKYLSGTTLISTTRSDADHVVYGIFARDASMKTIRVFLKQTSVSGISNAGADVEFTRPILVEASSSTRAKELVTAYANQNINLRYRNVVK
jgi:hypothetical protein